MIAGDGNYGDLDAPANGALSAEFASPRGLALDLTNGLNLLFIADRDNNKIRSLNL